MNFKKFFKKIVQHVPRKSQGITLIVSIILSGMILAIGLGLVKILTTELQFSADLIFSEKAYFAAESGVEIALLELNKEPVQNTENAVIFEEPDFSGARSELTIENLEDEFGFNLTPKETVKLRLRKDTDPGKDLNLAIQPVTNFKISVNPAGDVRWKIICTKTMKDEKAHRTVSIQNTLSSTFMEISSQSGTYDDEDGASSNTSVSTFFANLGDEDQKTCFLSLTNLANTNLEITFSNTEMPPPRAKVIATGKAGNREKTIIFEYAQKRLSPFFDFGLLHIDRKTSGSGSDSTGTSDSDDAAG